MGLTGLITMTYYTAFAHLPSLYPLNFLRYIPAQVTWLPDVPPCLAYLVLMWPRDEDHASATAHRR